MHYYYSSRRQFTLYSYCMHHDILFQYNRRQQNVWKHASIPLHAFEGFPLHTAGSTPPTSTYLLYLLLASVSNVGRGSIRPPTDTPRNYVQYIQTAGRGQQLILYS